MKRITIALGAALAMLALGMALGLAMPMSPAVAHHVTEHEPYKGHKWYTLKNAVICLRIDTGVPTDIQHGDSTYWYGVKGDEQASITVWYHNRDGNWQEWLNDNQKFTLVKSNKAADSPQSYTCFDEFPEAWVRHGHEAMHVYGGNSDTNNTNTVAYTDTHNSHPYKVNAVNHFWQANGRYWCFVTGRKIKNTTTYGDIAKWWVHLKGISGSSCAAF